MARVPLSQMDDWELEDKNQDLRGQPLVDQEGRELGTVEEMIVDVEAERVDALRLENGTEYPASSFEIRDGAAHLLRDRGTTIRSGVSSEHEPVIATRRRVLRA